MRKLLIIPDTHSPYEDKKAWTLMLKAARTFKPDSTIILGDFADFYAVSSHSKHPDRAYKLDVEVTETIARLKEVRSLGATENIFVSGNHEDRLERYLKDKAPELYNFITIPNLLQLKKLGFTYVPYKDFYRLGKLHITHDAGNCGRHAHLKALDVFQRNIITGHNHRMSYAVEGAADGKRHVTATFGWLGDGSQIDYMHRIKLTKDWQLGFGIGYLLPNGTVHLVPVPIIDYQCVIEGKLIK